MKERLLYKRPGCKSYNPGNPGDIRWKSDGKMQKPTKTIFLTVRRSTAEMGDEGDTNMNEPPCPSVGESVG